MLSTAEHRATQKNKHPEHPDKNLDACQEVHDPVFFSAPQFTGPRRHALLIWFFRLAQLRSAPPSPGTTGSAATAWRCGGSACVRLRMLERVPVHGMQGVLENQPL